MKKLEAFVIELLCGMIAATILVACGMWWLIVAGGTVA